MKKKKRNYIARRKQPYWYTEINLQRAFAIYCKKGFKKIEIAKIFGIGLSVLIIHWQELESMFAHFRTNGNFGLTEGEKKSKKGQSEKFTNERAASLITFAELGYTIDECCNIVGIVRRTIYNWFDAYPDFEKKFKYAKKNLIKVTVDALKKRAHGFKEDDEYISNYRGEIIRAKTTKYYPPSTEALKFILRNQDDKNWNKDKGFLNNTENKGLIMELLENELDKDDID
jgi:transposase